MLKLWAADDGGALSEARLERVPRFAVLAPDGRRAAIVTQRGAGFAPSEHDEPLTIVDAASGRKLLALDDHTVEITHAAWDPTGERIVSSSRDGTARIWDSRSGALRSTITSGAALLTAELAPDGARVVTGDERGSAKIWNATDGRVLFTLDGHSAAVNFACFSPDGTLVLTASDDKTAILWDARRGTKRLALVGHKTELRWGAFSADGALVVTTSQDGAKVWDVDSGRVLESFSLSGGVETATFSHQGRRLAVVSDDGTLDVWNLPSDTLNSLNEYVECRIPLHLEGERVVPHLPSCEPNSNQRRGK
jgi:WD40 repeat protein